MSKSRVTGGWLSLLVSSCPPGANARLPRLLQWPSKEGSHCMGMGICPSWECNRTVLFGPQCSLSDFVHLETSGLRSKAESAKVRAPLRRPSSWRRRKRPRESIWGCYVARSNPFSFQERWAGHSFVSSLHSSDTGRTCVSWFSRSSLSVCSLQAGAVPGVLCQSSNLSDVLWIQLSRWPRWEIALYLYGPCKHVSEFLKLSSRQRSAFWVLEYLLRFHSLPPKRVPVFSGPFIHQEYWECQANIQRGYWCDVGLRVVGCRRTWKFAKWAGWLQFFNCNRALQDVHSERSLRVLLALGNARRATALVSHHG